MSMLIIFYAAASLVCFLTYIFLPPEVLQSSQVHTTEYSSTSFNTAQKYNQTKPASENKLNEKNLNSIKPYEKSEPIENRKPATFESTRDTLSPINDSSNSASLLLQNNITDSLNNCSKGPKACQN